MKHVRLLFLALLFPLCVFSQNSYKDYVSKGDIEVTKGKYEVAKQQFEAAMVLLKKKDAMLTSNEGISINKKAVRAERCIALMKEAESAFGRAEQEKTEDAYAAAKIAYQKIVKEQSTDAYSKGRIAYCDAQIAQLEQVKMEMRVWADMHRQGDPTKETYKQFLEKFPKGRYEKEALQKIGIIEEEEFWSATARINTKEAYLNYIKKSKLGNYKSEAEMAVNGIEDREAWQKALATNTIEAYNAYIDNKNPAKQYQRQAVAQRSKLQTVIDIKTRPAQTADAGEAAKIVNTLEEASKVAVLSEEEKEILKTYRQIDDYMNFSNKPTITAGLQYLSNYPNSEYVGWVSDKLSELYANDLSEVSTETDYKRALSYAQTDNAKKYVQKKISASKQAAKNAEKLAHKKAQAKEQAAIEAWKQNQKNAKIEQRELNSAVRRQNWSDRVQMGIGLEGEMNGGFVYGPKLEFKLGAATNVFNFAFGAKYLFWNPEYIFSESTQNIMMTQVPAYAYMKLNLFRTGQKSRFYIAGEGAYNFNLKAQYRDEYTDGYVVDNNMILKNNITATGRLGFCWPHGEFSFYYKHNISSPFDLSYMSNSYSNLSVDKRITSSFNIGISYTCYIIF